MALPLVRPRVPEVLTSDSGAASAHLQLNAVRQLPGLRGDFVPHRAAGREVGQETFWR